MLPSFDWHLTNLSNYVNLSVVPYPPKKIGDLTLSPREEAADSLAFRET
jgi:penicillin V acylase-like amidase (Ntn superfamily)